MTENLYLPIPTSPMFIGDEEKVLTIEWQEFFRILFNRVGGVTASSTIDDLESRIESLSFPKSYDRRIDDLELGFLTFNSSFGNTKIRRISQNAQPA